MVLREGRGETAPLAPLTKLLLGHITWRRGLRLTRTLSVRVGLNSSSRYKSAQKKRKRAISPEGESQLQPRRGRCGPQGRAREESCLVAPWRPLSFPLPHQLPRTDEFLQRRRSRQYIAVHRAIFVRSSVSFKHVMRAEQRHSAAEFFQLGWGERFVELGRVGPVCHVQHSLAFRLLFAYVV